jgi:uncharacterized protein YqhQ
MRKYWTGDQNWTTFLILFVLLLILTGFAYPKEVRMIPFVVGFPTLFLLLILWVGGFNPGFKRWVDYAVGEGQEEKEGPEKSEKGTEFTEWKPVMIIMGWVLLFFIFVFLFGFALVSPVFMACFLIRKAEMRWHTAILYAIVAVGCIYALMEGIIKADLWCGAIPEVIPGWLGGAIIPPL